MRNPKGSIVKSNFQLGKEIDQLYLWFRQLDLRLEVIEEHLNHPESNPKPKKVGLEQFLDD